MLNLNKHEKAGNAQMMKYYFRRKAKLKYKSFDNVSTNGLMK